MSHPEYVATTLKEIIAAQLEVDPLEVTPQASFVDDLRADSLALVELVLAVEEAFEVKIPDEDQEKLHTVADVTAYILARVKA
jgi:acyl carrier protein